MLVAEYKARIQSKFEGGKSLTVDWYENAKEAGEALRGQISPHALKRVVPLYGGLNSETDVYYCPDDVDVPSALYNPKDTRIKWNYMPSQIFHLNNEDNKFTIETINGVRFIIIRQGLVSGGTVLDEFDSVGTKTGVALSANTFNFLTGSGALSGTFSDTLTDILDTFVVPIDITSFKEGVVMLPINFANANDVASVQFELYTDALNYYSMNSTVDSVGNYFKTGWNMVRFDISRAVVTGIPVDTNITSYKLSITMKTGKTQVVIIDRISLQKGLMYNFEYYSNYLFRDKSTNAWKGTAEHDADILNLDDKEASIIVYEGCRLVGFGAKKKKGMPAFDTELMRKYNTYWANNPSSELPPMYSGAPDISKTFIL